MTQATGSRHSVSYVAESTFGTTPSTPSMLQFRHTGTTLNVEKDNFVSEEIRNDRQITDMRHGVRRASGDLSFELCYGDFDDWLAAAFFNDWSTNVLKTGTTKKSFTVERAHAGVSEYFPFTGIMVNSMALNIAPNAMVTGTFGVIGTGAMTPSATPLDADVTAAAGNNPFDAFSGTITEGGSAAKVTSLSLSLANNLEATYVIGSDTAVNIIDGQSNLTGSLTALFETEALLNKFLNETESTLALTLAGVSGGDLAISLPRIKYTSGSIPVASANEGLLVSMDFQALKDTSEATNIKLTRTPA